MSYLCIRNNNNKMKKEIRVKFSYDEESENLEVESELPELEIIGMIALLKKFLKEEY